MNNNEFLEMLTKSIVSVTINDDKIFGKFEINYYTDKYSSIKNPSLRLFIDNKPLKTRNTYVTYKCPNCNDEKTILLKKFLLKETLYCSYCKEQISDKKTKNNLNL